MSAPTHEELEARVRAATALRKLNHAMVAHRADLDTLEEIADQAELLRAALEGPLRRLDRFGPRQSHGNGGVALEGRR